MNKLFCYQEFFIFNEKGRGLDVELRVGTPIPELKLKNKIAIFMLGPPASGKSTFVKKVILPINDNFKQINSDDISMIVQKWKEEGGKKDFITTFNPARQSTTKTHAYILQMIKSGNNFIYDTTGQSFDTVNEFSNIARNNNYKCIFIHVLVDLKTAIERNSIRLKKNTQPPVDIDYIKVSHKGVVSLIKKYIENIDWEKDSYYVVTTKDFELNFYKIIKNNILFYWDRTYINTNMTIADFYKKLNEGLRKFYGYDILLENLGITKDDHL